MAGLGRRDTVVGDREVVPADQAVVLIRRRAVRNQAEQAKATSTMLMERCLRAVAQSLAVCGQAAEGHATPTTLARWRPTAGGPPPASTGRRAWTGSRSKG